MKMVYVKWIDSYGCEPNWVTVSELEMEAVEVHSVGFLVKETADTLVLAPNFYEHNDGRSKSQVCGHIAIPRSAVLQTKEFQSEVGKRLGKKPIRLKELQPAGYKNAD